MSDRLEFRPRENGEFDEIVARFGDGMVHVETMSGTSCYVGFYWNDGLVCQWYINSARKLTYHHEVSRSVAAPPDTQGAGYGELVERLRERADLPSAYQFVGEKVEQLFDPGLRHRPGKKPFDYLRQWISMLRPFAFATRDDSWGEMEKLLCIVMRNYVEMKRLNGDAATAIQTLTAENERLEAKLARAREALEPFGVDDFEHPVADENGWTEFGQSWCRERIVDWFGPSQFLAAREALTELSEPKS
jgi:hypothetical protein